ncbi:MAG: formate C-acetyltransferase/glycerol dehydratase family glycyl radical enzyme, partial [Victivallales bacterium]|nr:formate C-acetyltransferase/glycerol dehydratase family glycyl radical enzyme [Victivallales bacterium]
FSRRLVPWHEFRTALAEDFVTHASLRAACRNAPKFGSGDERADRHATRLMKTMHASLDEIAALLAPVNGKLFRCVETDMQHLRMGRQLGATPDGRRAEAPVSENSSPSVGASTAGITAMFHSLAKLPFDQCHSGALNVRLQPAVFQGDAGVERLAALVQTYFQEGGLQVQVSMVDVDTLRAAQAKPTEYRDLMVRITGYSAAFVDMSEGAQNEIIRREEMAG